MAHYAFLDKNNIVTEVIVGRNEDEVVDGISDWESHYGEVRGQVCKRTSYNTYGGVNIRNGQPFRKNYAGIGFLYNQEIDAFIPPKPFPSWILDEETCFWNAPVGRPDSNTAYVWDESILNWVDASIKE